MNHGNESETPNHFLLIPHGIRSYSEKINCSILDAYDATSIVFKDVIKWIFVDFGVNEFSFIGLTLNAMQTRPQDELTPIIEVESTVYEDPDFIEFLIKNDIKVKFIGIFSKLPKYYIRAMKNLEKMTDKCEKKKLNILIGYGIGKKSLYQRIKKKLFRDVFTKNPPDIIVSTGDKEIYTFFDKVPEETRTLVVDTLFPELTREDIGGYIREYLK